MNIQTDVKTLLANAEKNFEEQKVKINELDDKISDLETKSNRPQPTNAPKQPESKKEQSLHAVKYWLNSKESNYSDYGKKGLGFNNSPALSEAQLNADVIEQAIENNAILSAVGKRATRNLEYRRTVLTQRPNSKLTKENTAFANVQETDASDYSTIDAQFVKAFSYPQITYEAANYSDVQIATNLMRLMSEDHASTMQQQVLHGSGIANVDGIVEVKGMTNAMIDRANVYAEALKPAATRDRGTLAAVKTDSADNIGSTSDEVEANLYKLMLTVPERSQASAQFAMNENTLSFLMRTLKDTQGRSLIQIELMQDKGIWVRRISLFGAQIILNQTIDDIGAGNAPIIFGDFKSGVELLQPSEAANYFIQDPYTIPDCIKFYQSTWFGTTVADHEALAVLVCVA